MVESVSFVLSKYKYTRLSRVHFHSLSYHLICQKVGRWSSPGVAVGAGSVRVTMKACGLDASSPPLGMINKEGR